MECLFKKNVMKKQAHELIFISQIKRDGNGTIDVSDDLLDSMLNNPLCKNDFFKLHRLSLSEKTYIAIGFNSFIVKLKQL